MRRLCPLCQQQLAENLLIFWLAGCAEYYQQVGPNTKSDLTAFTVDGFSKGGQSEPEANVSAIYHRIDLDLTDNCTINGCIRVDIDVTDIQVQEPCFVQQDGLIGVDWVDWGRTCVTT